VIHWIIRSIGFKKANSDFYNGYFAARVIVNRAATHAAPKKPTPTPP